MKTKKKEISSHLVEIY